MDETRMLTPFSSSQAQNFTKFFSRIHLKQLQSNIMASTSALWAHVDLQNLVYVIVTSSALVKHLMFVK
jgi:uroporphyrinogen-III synthase